MGQSNFLQALGWAVLNSLWQLALLWVAYQTFITIFRIKKSAIRSSLATVLLFSGFGWFIYTFLSLIAWQGHPSSAPGLLEMQANSQLADLLQSSLPVASVVYLVLLILPIINLVRNYRYVQLIRTEGLAKASAEWRIFVRNVSERMGINKPVKVWVSSLVNSPVTVGYLKPVILLPLAAVNQLTPVQMEAILLHELSHIRRYDYVINLITRMIRALLYFNPFVKAFSVIIERERERSCDELVLQFQYEPQGYAAALLTLEKSAVCRKRSLAVAAAGTKSNELLSRIETILGINKKPALSYQRLGAVLAGLLCIFGMNALIILSKPGSSNVTARHLTAEPSSLFFSDLAADEIPQREIRNEAASTAVTPVALASGPDAPTVEPALTTDPAPQQPDPSDYQFVNFTAPVIPELNAEQEEQVKQAFEMSKTVLEEVQWRSMEKTIADALTLAEKTAVKGEYHKALNKINWDKIENNLRIAYDNIDWKNVNASLQSAITEIKLDSIQQAYTLALSSLEELEEEMNEAKLEAIPDTDITVDKLATKKAELEKRSVQFRKARSKKIIRL